MKGTTGPGNKSEMGWTLPGPPVRRAPRKPPLPPRWMSITLGVLLGLLVIVLRVFYFEGSAMLNATFDLPSDNVSIPTDAASIERGKHLVQVICSDCHTSDLSGKNIISAPFAMIDSANLTPSRSGAGSEFNNADWVRALRHGVDDEGRALVVMPAQVFWNFSDEDLGDIVADLKTLPPVDKEHPDPQINILGKIMIGAGMFGKDIVPANVIAHTQRPPVIPVGVTARYGEYLVNVTGCGDCHGAQLAGGKSAGPGAMDAPNLTPGGDLRTWGKAEFIDAVRTGVAPSGHKLNPDEMPWKYIGKYTDDELAALFLYLQSLQPLPTIKP
jgi:mono/diheme cytochrome c family protein